ncbi:MAG: cytochrome c3 family protein [Bacillota bacterium]
MKEKNSNRNLLLTISAFTLLLVLQIIVLSACGSGSEKEKSPPTNQTEMGKVENQIADSCATGCHEMAPEITTWQASSHSQFDCTQCHQVNLDELRKKHHSKSFSKPIKVSNLISNDVCTKCHSKNRQITASGDLIIPHDKHDAQGLPCVKCHAGVVHAKIAERRTTVQPGFDDYSKWTPALASKVATSYYYSPDMWTCINCHKALSVTTKCGACHTTIPGLPSHDAPIWKTTHGTTARQSIGECTKCHTKPDAPKNLEPSTGDLSADFARVNDFCYNCHVKQPESHRKNMRKNHPVVAANRGLQNCFTCHNSEQPQPSDNVTGTYCNQCHWFTLEKPAPESPT